MRFAGLPDREPWTSVDWNADPGWEFRTAAHLERLVRAVPLVWEGYDQLTPLEALATEVLVDDNVARLFRETVQHEMVRILGARLGGGRGANMVAGCVVAQLMGLVVARYVLKVEPLASARSEEVIKRMAPGLRAVLLASNPSAPRERLTKMP